MVVRPALASDFHAIRKLIWRVRINPTGLDWRRFIVAVDDSGRLLGCGQIKIHKDGSRELASIAVQPKQWGKGIARAVIERLLSEEHAPLYLTCRSHLRPFYEKFGFHTVQGDDLPPHFRRIARAARLFGRIGIIPVDLLVMKRSEVI